MRIRSRWVMLPVAGLMSFAGELAGQAIVRGTVHDSLLTRAPLEGATVVLQGTTRSAVTDRRGRFEFRDLDRGRYAIGFFHPALDSLEIGAPARFVDVVPDSVVEVALATPSAEGVSRMLCGRMAETATTVLFGTVRSAEDDSALVGAAVLVRWFEVEIGATGVRQEERIARDSARTDGRYLLCGVPNDIALTLVATHAGQATGPLHLELGVTGVARRDLMVSLLDVAARRIADIAPDDTTPIGRVAGQAQLAVRLRGADGDLVSNAIVGVLGTTIANVTDASGAVVLRGIPAGTQTVVVRAVGRAPAQPWVQLRPHAETLLELTLSRFAQELPAVAVVGRRAEQLSAEIARRTRASGGRLFDGKALRELTETAGAWGKVPGVSLGADSDADALPLMRGALGARCEPTVWLDGMRIEAASGWELRGLLLNAQRVEVHTNPSRVPPEFTTSALDPCGVIAVWSR